MVKIAIIGSRSYTNKRKIKQFVWELKEKFGNELVIVSGGAKDGADKYAKRFALDFTRNTIKQAILTEYPLNDTSEEVLNTLEEIIGSE